MGFSEKSIVLVGLMGAGKSRVGTELARLMKLPFLDVDREIERAAGMKIPEIWERLGEKEFRDGEKKVMLRMLTEERRVLASGGGAYIQPAIRAAVKEKGIAVWLNATLETLVERTARTENRPLLQNTDRAQKLQELIDVRYPIYAEADITVVTDHQTPLQMARRIMRELEEFEKDA
ncbi:MAG: shikimate kinase [Alphaproteobacteria bacterium]